MIENPPYVRQELLKKKDKEFLLQNILQEMEY